MAVCAEMLGVVWNAPATSSASVVHQSSSPSLGKMLASRARWVVGQISTTSRRSRDNRLFVEAIEYKTLPPSEPWRYSAPKWTRPDFGKRPTRPLHWFLRAVISVSDVLPHQTTPHVFSTSYARRICTTTRGKLPNAQSDRRQCSGRALPPRALISASEHPRPTNFPQLLIRACKTPWSAFSHAV
jgi:hypothetical protein